jgi:hypothetical protein
MSDSCINEDSFLLLNPENDNGCHCQCRAHWIDITKKPLKYGSQKQFVTHFVCSQCGHYLSLEGIATTSIGDTDIQGDGEGLLMAISKVNH